jgi:hypothetical protein
MEGRWLKYKEVLKIEMILLNSLQHDRSSSNDLFIGWKDRRLGQGGGEV